MKFVVVFMLKQNEYGGDSVENTIRYLKIIKEIEHYIQFTFKYTNYYLTFI